MNFYLTNGNRGPKGIVKNVGIIIEVFKSIFISLARGLVVGTLPLPTPMEHGPYPAQIPGPFSASQLPVPTPSRSGVHFLLSYTNRPTAGLLMV